MISWIIIILVAYLFFSLSSFGDKLVLAGPPDSKAYTFWVGMFNVFVVLLIPFGHVGLPSTASIGWIILEAIVFILGIYFAFSAVDKFDISRVGATLGAIQPIFIFILAWLFFGVQELKIVYLVAFLMLMIGGFFISLGKKLSISVEYIKLVLIASLLFALDYIFSKLVFLNEPFLQGLVWMRLCVFVFSFVLLLSKRVRKEVFTKRGFLNKKTEISFVFTQVAGAAGGLLQSFAISLTPVAYLALLSALRGVQYVFLFAITVFVSYAAPRVFKEEISKKIIIQKVVAILFIVFGLGILFI